MFVFEPQTWKSYRKKRALTPQIKAMFKTIALKPSMFEEYLVNTVGFKSCAWLLGRGPLLLACTRPVSLRPSPIALTPHPSPLAPLHGVALNRWLHGSMRRCVCVCMCVCMRMCVHVCVFGRGGGGAGGGLRMC